MKQIYLKIQNNIRKLKKKSDICFSVSGLSLQNDCYRFHIYLPVNFIVLFRLRYE